MKNSKNFKNRVLQVLFLFVTAIIFVACAGNQNSVNKFANTNKIRIFGQELYYPKSWNESIYNTSEFRAKYIYDKKSSYRYSREKSLILLENVYETVNFESLVYIQSIKFDYNNCRKVNALSSGLTSIASVALSPLMLFGTSVGVKSPYAEMTVYDMNNNKSIESDNDKYIGCDFDFKYTGLTNKLKIDFNSMHVMSKRHEDIVKNRSLENYYIVKYIPNRVIVDIIKYNLTNRDNSIKNDELIMSVLKSDPSLYEYLKDQNKTEKFKVSRYSILNLPNNADIKFSVENSVTLLEMGIYRDQSKGILTTNNFFETEELNDIKILDKELDYSKKNDLQKFYSFNDELHDYTNNLIQIWYDTIDFKETRLKIDGKQELKEYEKLRKNLISNYLKYDKNRAKFDKELDKELAKTNQYYKDLKRYFRYKKNKSARNKYRSFMKRKFGKVLDDSIWCKDNICPSKDAIENVIINEAGNRWYSKSKGISPYLTMIEFFNHATIKNELINELNKKLKKEGVFINTFSHGYENFKNLIYDSALKNKYQEIQNYYKGNNKLIDIEKTLKSKSWKEFIEVNNFKTDLAKICNDEKLTDIIYNRISSETIDLTDTYKLYKEYN